MKSPSLSAWENAEERFAVNGYDGDTGCDTGSGLAVLGGREDAFVIVTAPHAVNHERDGRRKLADRGTGGLAVLLAERTGAGALVMARHDRGDANHDRRHPMKDVLRPLCRGRVVVDLHGMRDEPGCVDVIVGSGCDRFLGAPLAEAAREAFDAYGLGVGVDDRFAAAGANRLSRFAHSLGVPAIQVELAARLRPPAWDPVLAEAAVRALEALVGRVQFRARSGLLDCRIEDVDLISVVQQSHRRPSWATGWVRGHRPSSPRPPNDLRWARGNLSK